MNGSAIEILLVEDNEKDVRLTLHALRAENLANSVHIARDGEEALDFLNACESELRNGNNAMPRLVLLDLKLPKVDGLDVLRQIKTSPTLKRIPVVVLTSSKEESDLVNSYRLGVNSYLQKPVSFDEFRKMVKQLGFYWLLLNQLPGVPDPAEIHAPDAR